MAEGARSWVSFDCYGTLVDWRTGMESAIGSVVEPALVGRVLGRYHELEPSLQKVRPMLTYRQVLTAGLAIAATDCGIRLTPDESSVLWKSMPTWPVFPEVGSILDELVENGHSLAILSNVDDEVIAQTIPQLGGQISAVITAQDVGSYKPDVGHFDAMAARVAADRASWVHVACSWFHDVEPCLARDVPAVFVNRERTDIDTATALATLPDLADLPDILNSNDR